MKGHFTPLPGLLPTRDGSGVQILRKYSDIIPRLFPLFIIPYISCRFIPQFNKPKCVSVKRGKFYSVLSRTFLLYRNLSSLKYWFLLIPLSHSLGMKISLHIGHLKVIPFPSFPPIYVWRHLIWNMWLQFLITVNFSDSGSVSWHMMHVISISSFFLYVMLVFYFPFPCCVTIVSS